MGVFSESFAQLPSAPQAPPAALQLPVKGHIQLNIFGFWMNVSEAPVWIDLGKVSRHEEECFPRISSFKEDGYRKGKALILIGPEVLRRTQYLLAQSLGHIQTQRLGWF